MTQQNQQQVSERNNVVVLARQASPGFFACIVPAIRILGVCCPRSTRPLLITCKQRHPNTVSIIEQETRQRQQPGRLQSTQTRPSAIAAPFARSLNRQTIRDDGSDKQTPAANLTTPSQVAGDVDSGSGKWKRPLLVSVRRGSNY
ncbi:hypothetical protein GQ600_16492 [Phytophthora cactorum]|nr:hypothetical protein GQ600_16492 [Phytophthora cactorum]